MYRVISLLCLAIIGIVLPVVVIADESNGFDPELALRSDFHADKYWPGHRTGAGSKRIEFCGGDWCQEVVIKRSQSRDAAWAALFLMFYFHDANEQYVSRREGLALAIIDRYGGKCLENESIARAACVLKQLRAMHFQESLEIRLAGADGCQPDRPLFEFSPRQCLRRRTASARSMPNA
jgi:hypothetical protein